MAEDILRRLQRKNLNRNFHVQWCHLQWDISWPAHLSTSDGRPRNYHNLGRQWTISQLCTCKRSTITEEMMVYIADNEHKLMENQLAVYKMIILSIEGERRDLFFHDAWVWTGKTFIINLFLSKLCQTKHIAVVLYCSCYVVAAQPPCVLNSFFTCPKSEMATCNTRHGSINGKLFSDCKLINWDGVTMSHKNSFEALDIGLQDLSRNTGFMGSSTKFMHSPLTW